MPDTSPLFRQSDDARADLETFNRHVAEAKDRCREAVLWLAELTRVRDDKGRCFSAILEAIDDMVAEKRDAIRARVEEADIEIENAERAA